VDGQGTAGLWGNLRHAQHTAIRGVYGCHLYAR
jgi:hypothetical protein